MATWVGGWIQVIHSHPAKFLGISTSLTKRVVLCQEYDEEIQTSDQVHEALRGGHAFKPMETCRKCFMKGGCGGCDFGIFFFGGRLMIKFYNFCLRFFRGNKGKFICDKIAKLDL